MAEGIFDKLRGGVQSEEEVALKFLFPASSKFEMLQMLSDHQPRAVNPFSVLGVFRWKYKSKVLARFQTEYNINKIAQERKGRLEGSEVVAGVRRSSKEEE